MSKARVETRFSVQFNCALLFPFGALILLFSCKVGAQEDKIANPATRWEKSIAAFEKLDKERRPQTGGVLFLGSSSIRMWKLDKWFSGINSLNRGFGGSEISDSIFFFDRIVLPYRPRAIVFYAGDNDIAKGKSAEKVAADFKTFVGKVKESLPETKIVFIAIKPSIARWKLVEKMRQANQLVQAFAATNKAVEYADIDKPMIGKDGKPRKDLFLDDGLHLNETGYKIWYEVIEPFLK